MWRAVASGSLATTSAPRSKAVDPRPRGDQRVLDIGEAFLAEKRFGHVLRGDAARRVGVVQPDARRLQWPGRARAGALLTSTPATGREEGAGDGGQAQS